MQEQEVLKHSEDEDDSFVLEARVKGQKFFFNLSAYNPQKWVKGLIALGVVIYGSTRIRGVKVRYARVQLRSASESC